MGGLPMTENLPNECGEQDPNNIPTTNTGWHYCSDGDISTSWRLHEGVAEYYTDGYIPSQFPQVGNGQTVDGNTVLDSLNIVGTRIFPEGQDGTVLADEIRITPDNTGFINLTSGASVGNPNFSGLSDFVSGRITNSNSNRLNIRAGDYVWIKPEVGDDHGFIVIGWGKGQSCLDALDEQEIYYPTYSDAVDQYLRQKRAYGGLLRYSCCSLKRH